VSLFILDKNNFRTELGRQLAHKYFGYTYDEEQSRAAMNGMPLETRVEPTTQRLPVGVIAPEDASLAVLHHEPIFTFPEQLPILKPSPCKLTKNLNSKCGTSQCNLEN